MYFVVFGVGVPAAFRNPTSAALVLSWLVGEVTWLRTGNSLSLSVYFMCDVFVIAMICAKATIREGCRTYPTLRLQIQCAWQAMTTWDRWITGGFIFVAWPIYVSNLHPYYQWWSLFTVTILQFILSGGEALTSLLGERKRRVMSDTPGDPNGLALAGHWGGS